MRIFVALDIDDAIRERIGRFLDGVRPFAPDARWVHPESLHVTLKFVGEKPLEVVEEIKRALLTVRGDAIEIAFHGYGFFPGTKAPRVFWVGVEAGPQLAALATVVDQAIAALGIPKEEHPFSPHLTLARGGGSGGASGHKQSFRQLQEKLAILPTPEFGTMTARKFFLYRSQLMRGGARYSKVADFALG
jgi:2'-5' RNA ligase